MLTNLKTPMDLGSYVESDFGWDFESDLGWNVRVEWDFGVRHYMWNYFGEIADQIKNNTFLVRKRKMLFSSSAKQKHLFEKQTIVVPKKTVSFQISNDFAVEGSFFKNY